MMFASPSLLVLALASTATVSATGPSVKEILKRKLINQKLPESPGEEWTTLENGMEFLPAANLSPRAKHHMRRLTNGAYSIGGVYEQAMVDGSETYYDDYAQAWRALGFYIDCSYTDEDESGCQRFMLWAAYVDEEYEGNEIGEYMFYDRKNKYWDDRTCIKTSSSRCVKMDCHLPSTHFSLLGFFKEANYDEWFGQLFKHQGDCVWTDQEYGFMQGNRDVWPDGCTATGLTATAKNGDSVSLYYDIKPAAYGDMAIGLYTDTSCVVEYDGELTATEAMKQLVCGNGQKRDRNLENGDACSTGESNYNDAVEVLKQQGYYKDENHDGHHDVRGDVWELASSLDEWNAAFDVYKQCQPCKTYDLTNMVADSSFAKNYNGMRYNWTSAAMNGGDAADDDDGEVFVCSDAAGYDNVNQCYKFQSKTEMLTATFKDIEMAMMHGSIAQVPFSKNRKFVYSTAVSNNVSRGEQRKAAAGLFFGWLFLIASAALLALSAVRYVKIKKEADATMKEPLMPSDNGVAA